MKTGIPKVIILVVVWLFAGSLFAGALSAASQPLTSLDSLRAYYGGEAKGRFMSVNGSDDWELKLVNKTGNQYTYELLDYTLPDFNFWGGELQPLPVHPEENIKVHNYFLDDHVKLISASSGYINVLLHPEGYQTISKFDYDSPPSWINDPTVSNTNWGNTSLIPSTPSLLADTTNGQLVYNFYRQLPFLPDNMFGFPQEYVGQYLRFTVELDDTIYNQVNVFKEMRFEMLGVPEDTLIETIYYMRLESPIIYIDQPTVSISQTIFSDEAMTSLAKQVNEGERVYFEIQATNTSQVPLELIQKNLLSLSDVKVNGVDVASSYNYDLGVVAPQETITLTGSYLASSVPIINDATVQTKVPYIAHAFEVSDIGLTSSVVSGFQDFDLGIYTHLSSSDYISGSDSDRVEVNANPPTTTPTPSPTETPTTAPTTAPTATPTATPTTVPTVTPITTPTTAPTAAPTPVAPVKTGESNSSLILISGTTLIIAVAITAFVYNRKYRKQRKP